MTEALREFMALQPAERLGAGWRDDDALFKEAMRFCMDRERQALRSMRSTHSLTDQKLVPVDPVSIQLGRIEAKQDLVNGKLDALFELLASEDDGGSLPQRSLDGELLSGERDTTQAL